MSNPSESTASLIPRPSKHTDNESHTKLAKPQKQTGTPTNKSPSGKTLSSDSQFSAQASKRGWAAPTATRPTFSG
ncbi:hypothetical protein BD779DRAFT_1498415 [Infundibulicybe gibba]|nr:hypothetical protein BD779DRAFT_1498415 [Infundibulicybe gibba]